MHCPSCAIDINDPVPSCSACGFHIRDLDAELGEPPPRGDGPVADLAGALGAEDAARIAARLAAARERAGVEMLVVTVPTSAPRKPSEHAFWLFERWDVGGETHAGVLVLLAMAERRIEVEVGYPLEEHVSDAVAGEILREHAVPFLSAGRTGEGVLHAVGVLASVLENARAGEGSAP